MPDCKKLILVRHAHRDTDEGRERDNGLSQKGFRQTEKVLSYWLQQPLPGAAFISSPKRRCVETLEPLAQELKQSLEIDPSLDEQRKHESDAAFRARVKHSLNALKDSSAPIVVVCSHSDWLTSALEELTGEPVELKKGAWTEYTLH